MVLILCVENLIGQGGHAEVYKGYLRDGQVIAVKRLTNYEKEDGAKASDFLAELGIIAHINHPNAARLIGFAVDNGLYFVLQYASRGSLSSLLFGSSLIPSFSIYLLLIFFNKITLSHFSILYKLSFTIIN